VDLSVGGGLVDFFVDHGQQVGNPSHADAHLDVRFHQLVHFAQVVVLSLDAPQLAEPTEVMLLQLLLENVDLFKSVLDFLVESVATDRIGQEETVHQTVRFDQSIKVHKLPASTLVAAEGVDLGITERVPSLGVCSSMAFAANPGKIYLLS
jgi:hypothetical protein